ncbi:MAG TPA: MFS transporter [Acidimicrobiales bacterium]|nr:MFS transporter [Acidimicrobiales bacterium]
MSRPEAAWSPSVVALLVSVFAAMGATACQVTALGKQVFDLTGRPLDLGLLGLAEFAPAALLVLVTGAVADRHERRLVAATAAAGEAAVSFALAAYAGSDPTSVGPVFALVFVFGVARAFAAPASRALLSDVVPPTSIPWMIARFSFVWQAAVVVGPVLGGFLYVADVRLPYLASAVLLLVAAGSLALVRPLRTARVPVTAGPPPTSPGDAVVAAVTEPALGAAVDAPRPARAGLHDAVEGFRYIRGVPVLLGAISLDLFAVLFGGAVGLLPAIATDRLHVGAVGLGWLRAAIGVGAGVVTLILTVRPVRRRVGITLMSVVALFGVFTVVLGLTRSFAVAFGALAVLSGADAVSVFIRASLVPLLTPEDKRGRVLAVENVFIGGSNELGAFESGVAGQVLGASGAVVLGGVATLAVTGAWWFLFPDLRKVDRFPDPPRSTRSGP